MFLGREFLIEILVINRTCLEYSLSKVFLSYGHAYRRTLCFLGDDIILLGHIYWLLVSKVREIIQFEFKVKFIKCLYVQDKSRQNIYVYA